MNNSISENVFSANQPPCLCSQWEYILRSAKFSSHQKIVMMILELLSWTRQQRTIEVSEKDLRFFERSGLKRITVYRHLTELQELGVIQKRSITSSNPNDGRKESILVTLIDTYQQK